MHINYNHVRRICDLFNLCHLQPSLLLFAPEICLHQNIDFQESLPVHESINTYQNGEGFYLMKFHVVTYTIKILIVVSYYSTESLVDTSQIINLSI